MILKVALCIIYLPADWSQGIQFPDDEQQNGSQSTGLFAILPPDVAASPRKFYMNSLDIKRLDYTRSWEHQGIITFYTSQWN